MKWINSLTSTKNSLRLFNAHYLLLSIVHSIAYHWLISWTDLGYVNQQKDEPPEITYCVVNQNGMLHLQPLSPSLPMPEQTELDAKFTELLVR